MKLKFNIMNYEAPPGGDAKAPALLRGFCILDLLACEPGLDFTAIHTRLGLPKSSTHHLMTALLALGAVKKLPGGGFCLGLRMAELGERASGLHGLADEALPHLRSLSHEVKLTCHLGVLEGYEAVYLARVECELLDIRVNSWVGKRFSLYSSALGKALLAWLPEDEREDILANITFAPKMPKTITSADDFRTHLEGVRATGWAVDDEEDVPNIRCIAAPIRNRQGRVVAAISAVGTSIHVDQARFNELGPVICRVAADVEDSQFGRSTPAPAGPKDPEGP